MSEIMYLILPPDLQLVHQNSLNISTDASTARQGADDALTVKAASCEPHPDIECLQDEDDLDVFRYSASTLDDPESYILDIMVSGYSASL